MASSIAGAMRFDPSIGCHPTVLNLETGEHGSDAMASVLVEWRHPRA
ncbi:MAG: hypothetical protein QN122_12985 [Armatimonadota bacterium]|nr:hypothetical protein [Armatimonadota bacterium]MDR7460169.1 hypothetical protein [Armatimonadota bacterium]MDR7480747.1 hypothetical protein [Armatimonadota bacterium]MDR7488907.1 hypothetical protein [Armatimonadota bacterium]MDR7492350.1 hypothetical protein [Armatimonadota bacterium]